MVLLSTLSLSPPPPHFVTGLEFVMDLTGLELTEIILLKVIYYYQAYSPVLEWEGAGRERRSRRRRRKREQATRSILLLNWWGGASERAVLGSAGY